jgi:hypothetical protein
VTRVTFNNHSLIGSLGIILIHDFAVAKFDKKNKPHQGFRRFFHQSTVKNPFKAGNIKELW